MSVEIFPEGSRQRRCDLEPEQVKELSGDHSLLVIDSMSDKVVAAGDSEAELTSALIEQRAKLKNFRIEPASFEEDPR
jgi:hypothetical protein